MLVVRVVGGRTCITVGLAGWHEQRQVLSFAKDLGVDISPEASDFSVRDWSIIKKTPFWWMKILQNSPSFCWILSLEWGFSKILKFWKVESSSKSSSLFLCESPARFLRSWSRSGNPPWTMDKGVWPSPGQLLVKQMSWRSLFQWIGLRENLNRKPWIFPRNMGFYRLKFSPTNQSIAFYSCFFKKGAFCSFRLGNLNGNRPWEFDAVGRFPLLKTKLGAEKELRRDRFLAPGTIQWRSGLGLFFFGFGMTWHDLFPSQLRKKNNPKTRPWNHETSRQFPEKKMRTMQFLGVWY